MTSATTMAMMTAAMMVAMMLPSIAPVFWRYHRQLRAVLGRRAGHHTALLAAGPVLSQHLPIFDAHIHYSHDAWDVVPVQDAIAIMRKAGVKRALISSSGDDGQQRLFAAAPDLVIPELRVYRSRGEIGTWFRDETLIPYLEERLAKLNARLDRG